MENTENTDASRRGPSVFSVFSAVQNAGPAYAGDEGRAVDYGPAFACTTANLSA